jgi:nucleoside 2-deoxyribosyltransferase
MNICLHGSMRDSGRILEIARELKNHHHRVSTPLDLSEGRFADKTQAKRDFMQGMFEQIKICDSVLAVNDTSRGGVQGYIGPNTFLQLGIAMALGKQLFCLAKWDDRLPYKEELDAMGINLLDIKLPF